MKKWVLTLIAVAIFLTSTIPVSISSLLGEQITTSNDLGIQPLFQHKDTPMLCLDGCSLVGEHAWDSPHIVNSASDISSCDHCKRYCGFASIAMINHHYGGNLSQDRIAYHRNTSPDMGGPWLDHPEEDLYHGGLGTGNEATKTSSWALNGAEVYFYDGKPTLDEIKEWLSENRPILRLWGGHFTVIDGYDDSYIHVVNPNFASEKKILYDELPIARVWVPIDDNITARSDEPTIWQDSDKDGVVDFDEENRFFTDKLDDDTDGDLVPDKAEIRSYTFLSDDSFDSEDIRKPDADNDTLRAELDFDSDNGGTPDGLEDLNHNGKLDAGETDPFNATDDPYQMPIPSFEFMPETPSVNESITFNASASYDPDGNIVSYTWNFDDGNVTTVTEPIINHKYSSGGNYTVTLNATDNDGVWSITSKTLIVYEINHDIALVDVIPDKTLVGQGDSLSINVNVENQGEVTETFNLTVYWNSTHEIDKKEITLTNGTSTTITFEWNTTGFSLGNYTIKAIADQVPGETDTEDNEFIDGIITVSEFIHDIAVTDVTPQKTVVCQGYSMKINVTVANQGDLTETFNVTIYWNTTEIDTKEITLASGNSIVITFTWNTTGLTEYQNYTISAYAHPVPGETDTSNTFIDGLILTIHVGDVIIDKKVRVDDILDVALDFGLNEGDPDWDPITDINCDDKVRVDDILATATEFGWTIPSGGTIQGLTNTDNTLIDGIITIVHPGDINADKKVDMKDIGGVARLFGVNHPDPAYNPNYDINDDGKVDMKDIAIAARNFGYVKT